MQVKQRFMTKHQHEDLRGRAQLDSGMLVVGCPAVWEMWHGRRAHEGLLEAQIAAAVCCGDARPEWDGAVPPQLAALASDCWAQNPADR